MGYKIIFIVILLALITSACISGAALPPGVMEVPAMPTVTVVSPTKPIPTATFTLQPTTEIISSEPTPTSVPLPTPVHGIEMYTVDESGGLSYVKNAGAFWVRRNGLYWSEIEPSPGVRNWVSISNLESEMINASKAGLSMVMVVRRVPNWAQKVPNYFCGAVVESELDTFGEFMSDLVARYSIPPYNVMYWELGNEPDVAPQQVLTDLLYGCWGDLDDPYFGGGYYAEMLKAVYPLVKEANPDAQILVGGLLLDCDPNNPPESRPGSGRDKDCTSSLFLEGILKNGGGDYFDGVSFHAYDYYFESEGAYGNLNWNSTFSTTGPVLIAKSNYLKDVLTFYGYPEKYLINSEVGLVCGLSRTGIEKKCKTDAFLNTKAYYLVQANTIAIANGLVGNIWYNLYGWRGTGLLSSTREPQSVYTAYQFNAAILRESFFDKELTLDAGLMGYSFTRNDKNLWIVWAADREVHSIQLPAVPSDIFDSFGNEIEASREINVGIGPIYILLNKIE